MPLVDLYMRFVNWIAAVTGYPDTLLHVHAGMVIMTLAALILRRSPASPLPLAAVYLGEAFNEIMDRFAHGQWMPDTRADILNTVFWPTAVFLAVKIAGASFRHANVRNDPLYVSRVYTE